MPAVLSIDEGTTSARLVIDPCFSASKIRWILDNVPDARAKARDGEVLFGTVDTSLIWNLTGAFAVEGSVFIAGAVLQWLRDELGLIRTSSARPLQKASPIRTVCTSCRRAGCARMHRLSKQGPH